MQNLLIIQARMGSSRLPNKVLKELCGEPMLKHIVERVKQCRLVDYVIIATTVNQEDNAIDELCEQMRVECYRGSENDVLDRYFQAASQYNPQNVIRVTADCPVIDPCIIDEIIKIHIDGGYDYTSNTLVETYPDGIDTEIFKYKALKEAWEKANLASEREHVTPYIKFKSNFKRYSVERFPSLADKRWTVDTEQDFAMISNIYNALYKKNKIFLMEDVLKYLQQHGEIEELNAGIVRNEGYQKSLENDFVVEGK